MNRSWKQIHLDFLTTYYSPFLGEYAGHDDDRGIYCRTLEYMLSALESLPDEPHLYVRVAVSARMRDDIRMLDRIVLAFGGELPHRKTAAHLEV